ncbi:hypothetical protein [Halomonas sp. M4R1S46]|uniref:hypothetical protein n=1 Tax=Halomonas sp. M4R1S46 TaxID=2982692 RepID=UPI0021E482D6|nr:hypothetical protein [Halomonas sp. M4R1S46]UYG08053.1 hypothetical protein OCT48_01505 [Halomonas sp. M4R1S46]
MPFKRQDYPAILKAALASYDAGFDPSLIELPEGAVFPGLISASPATARKSRVTGLLLGMPAPRFVRRGRSIRYRLKDVLDWLANAEEYRSTAEISTFSSSVARETQS